MTNIPVIARCSVFKPLMYLGKHQILRSHRPQRAKIFQELILIAKNYIYNESRINARMVWELEKRKKRAPNFCLRRYEMGNLKKNILSRGWGP